MSNKNKYPLYRQKLSDYIQKEVMVVRKKYVSYRGHGSLP